MTRPNRTDDTIHNEYDNIERYSQLPNFLLVRGRTYVINNLRSAIRNAT